MVSIRTPADVASWLFDWEWTSFVTDRPPDENHFADAEQHPGVGSYNCSAEDIELQATTWRRMLSESKTRWQIHCAGPNVTRALHASSPGRLGKIFVDIGANKGYATRLLGMMPSSGANAETRPLTLIHTRPCSYVIASWLSAWAPELSISERALGPYWRDTAKVELPCGPCKDCEESGIETSTTYSQVRLQGI